MAQDFTSNLQKDLKKLQQELQSAWQKLNIEQKILSAKELEAEVAEPEIWLNPENARQKNEQLARLSGEIEPWKLLKTQIKIGRAHV